MNFLQTLGIWQTFKRGWSARVADVEAKAVAMWLACAGAAPAVARGELEAEGGKAASLSKKQRTAAGGLGVVGGGTAQQAATTHDPEWLPIGVGGAVLLVILIGLTVPAHHNSQRAKAYATAASAA